MTRLSLAKEKVQVLLLEGIHENAVADLVADGYTSVTRLPGALDEDELIRRLEGVHILGIRSRTKVTRRVLEAADRLIAIGCFCIGTDQVALNEARNRAIPVFNAPFSNTRSVAELVLGQIIMLMRGIFPKSVAAHRGEWIKSAANSWEVRGKTLGIVGYGNIGAQLSVLAESLGMHVIFHDIAPKLPLGRAEPCPDLENLLRRADVVSLHVPDTQATRWMIGERQIRAMRPGSFLINAARGTVVDVEALAAAIRDGHLLGAAVDVFPDEPSSAREEFLSPLRGLANVILTPHIGGSTAEAQARIGNEVARKLIDYSDVGSTFGAVNFPQVQLPARPSGTRFIHAHRNVPGILARVLDVFVRRGLNIGAQYLQTDGEIGYVVMDVDGGYDDAQEIQAELRAVEGTIRARFLYERH
ncbi:phosphoglycerate dehydrogenase [Geminicoccaceae bacterium SYSU G07066]|uniref:D-3-phosphoglycerate dehydrogenase n=1 Tax=Benzoatithermus flavus TaxID=3108223 RepID=A0ABU8XVC2_9PROT